MSEPLEKQQSEWKQPEALWVKAREVKEGSKIILATAFRKATVEMESAGGALGESQSYYSPFDEPESAF